MLASLVNPIRFMQWVIAHREEHEAIRFELAIDLIEMGHADKANSAPDGSELKDHRLISHGYEIGHRSSPSFMDRQRSSSGAGSPRTGSRMPSADPLAPIGIGGGSACSL